MVDFSALVRVGHAIVIPGAPGAMASFSLITAVRSD
jgi:hypothetical protein